MMKEVKETVIWKAVGNFAVRFVNGQWGFVERCKSHREAIKLAARLNDEENDYGSI